jgi:hypothetical protein
VETQARQRRSRVHRARRFARARTQAARSCAPPKLRSTDALHRAPLFAAGGSRLHDVRARELAVPGKRRLLQRHRRKLPARPDLSAPPHLAAHRGLQGHERFRLPGESPSCDGSWPLLRPPSRRCASHTVTHALPWRA